MPTNHGLRERKKLATRQALMDAALRLAVERGLDNVLVEDISNEAGVSPRTFNNYFSSKQEAISARAVDRARRIADELRTRPTDEPLWTSLEHAVAGQYETTGPRSEEWIEGARLLTSTPALQGEYLKSRVAIETMIARAVAERTGTDPARDLYPRLVAGAVTAATDVALVHWLETGTRSSLPGLLREALRRLAEGLATR